MSQAKFRLTPLCAALVALGLSAGVAAQDTSKSAGASTATTPSAGTKTPSSRQDDALARGDRKFVEKAATDGMMEVQLGEMAQQKAQSDQVKQFGARMAQDHGKANEELKQIASAKGVQLPTAMEKSQQKDMQKLEKLQGAEFDREYMKHMVDGHKEDVEAFQKQAKSGKDADLKSFAAKTLPTLQEHKKLADTTYASVKQSKKTASDSGRPATRPATKPYSN